ncbi:MAG: coproporphyrinogen III oxidase, partial [Methylophilales bacterium 16-45-7]
MINQQAVFEYLQSLQSKIVEAIELVDGKNFLQDSWQRPEGGGGTSCMLENGNVFERAGIGFSHVIGNKLPPAASVAHPEAAGRPWEAMGVSLVFHPRNPYIPTVHMNVRFFVAKATKSTEEISSPHMDETNTGTATNKDEDIWWFGGGMDLTPYYGFEEDCVHFHRTNKEALSPFGNDYYTQFKQACDEYFYLKHRKEPRGIGGVFFDDFHALGFEQSFAMLKAVGDAFLNAYLPIAQRRKDTPYGEIERDFQAYRRGRYVEFNLVF